MQRKVIVGNYGFKQVGYIVGVLYLYIMGQGYLLKQVLVVAHGGKMQPVFGDAVVRNMMIKSPVRYSNWIFSSCWLKTILSFMNKTSLRALH